MSVFYGFYDAVNGDRSYSASDMSSIFDGVITDGVFASVGEQFRVVPGTGMAVSVKSGRAWFNHTWTYNDASLELPLDAAGDGVVRIDAVVLEVNSSQEARANRIFIEKGREAPSNPVAPILIDEGDIHQHALATILIGSNVTSITQSAITNKVGLPGCPYVGPATLEVDLEQLYGQWDAEFNEWFAEIQEEMSGDVATLLLQRTVELRRDLDAITAITTATINSICV